MPTLTIFRGLPGSSKSTQAKKLGCLHVEADMFFMQDGEYKWSGDRVSHAHKWCYDSVLNAMSHKMDVVVSNTFTQVWEMEKYIISATNNGYDVVVYRCMRDFGNVHSVPEEAIQRMKERFENLDGEVEVW
jgi:adenylate kinase family enzyme